VLNKIVPDLPERSFLSRLSALSLSLYAVGGGFLLEASIGVAEFTWKNPLFL
jgi:hypothetical protein